MYLEFLHILWEIIKISQLIPRTVFRFTTLAFSTMRKYLIENSVIDLVCFFIVNFLIMPRFYQFKLVFLTFWFVFHWFFSVCHQVLSIIFLYPLKRFYLKPILFSVFHPIIYWLNFFELFWVSKYFQLIIFLLLRIFILSFLKILMLS